MKLSCTRDNLHQGLAITGGLAGKNTNLPILNNVLIKTEGGSLRLTTTNLETAAACSVRGKVEEEGEITVPAKLFFDYVSLLSNEAVEVVGTADELSISCGDNKTKIKGLAASEFPLVPPAAGGGSFVVPAEALRVALARVLFAVASNESRPELSGVSVQFREIESGKGELVLAATDSYRLAESTLPLVSAPAGASVAAIVPARALAEVARTLSLFKDGAEAPEQATIQLAENQAVFTFGSAELTSRTVEGEYPDYTQIIPKDFRSEAVLGRAEFIKAVKTASLFSRTGLFDVGLKIVPAEGRVVVAGADATKGENTAVCLGDVSGDEAAVTVNYRYLLDGLNALSTDKVLFRAIDGANPCLLTPQGEEGYQYIIMPIKQ